MTCLIIVYLLVSIFKWDHPYGLDYFLLHRHALLNLVGLIVSYNSADLFCWQVTIASQQRYVRYWYEILTFPRGLHNGPPNVNVPQPISRELRRIRVYDAVNIKSVFFVVSELEEVTQWLHFDSLYLFP